MYPAGDHDSTPKLLSVLVPLYNEAEFIQTVLERITRAPLPGGLEREIIVVDDASTDGSAELVDDFAARYPGFIRLIRCPKNRGKGAAVYAGWTAEAAEYEVLAFADADGAVSPAEIQRAKRSPLNMVING